MWSWPPKVQTIVPLLFSVNLVMLLIEYDEALQIHSSPLDLLLCVSDGQGRKPRCSTRISLWTDWTRVCCLGSVDLTGWRFWTQQPVQSWDSCAMEISALLIPTVLSSPPGRVLTMRSSVSVRLGSLALPPPPFLSLLDGPCSYLPWSGERKPLFCGGLGEMAYGVADTHLLKVDLRW